MVTEDRYDDYLSTDFEDDCHKLERALSGSKKIIRSSNWAYWIQQADYNTIGKYRLKEINNAIYKHLEEAHKAFNTLYDEIAKIE